MSNDDHPSKTAEERLVELGDAFWHLNSVADIPSDGFIQIAVGLNTLSEDIRRDDMPEEQLESVIEIFQSLLTTLRPADAPEPQTEATGLDQFVEGFRLEAQKHLAGLSISMTGIFNEPEDGTAIKESSQHLHAIKGGAAMLGLKAIAQLSGAMEDLILAHADAPADFDWPVKSLLQSYAILKSAIEDDEFVEVLAEELVEELRTEQRRLSNEDAKITVRMQAPNFQDRPKTIPNVRQLEQRILVVDDVETIAASVGFILSELDVPIDLANNAEDALKLLNEHAFSLVISDINMPGMSGLELVETMRRDPAYMDISVMLLTQVDSKESKRQAMAAGANDYVVKGSIGGEAMVERVNQLLSLAPYVPAVSEVQERQRKILVVEDTETIAASIAFVLSEGPYEILLAHDGQDAFHKLQRKTFDLILSDVEMPSMNGFELLTEVKKDGELRDIPFVMLTSRDDEEDHARAIELGAVAYLIKGDVGSEKLQHVVSSLLGG